MKKGPLQSPKTEAVLFCFPLRSEHMADVKIHTTVMIALYLPLQVAQDLAVLAQALGEFAMPSEEYHITLALPGEASALAARKNDVLAAVLDIARAQKPIVGKVNGLGRFSSESEKHPFYATFDAPALAEFRQELVEALAERGIENADDHGFTPHITLGYIPADAPTPDLPPPSIEATIEYVSLSWADERLDLPLTGDIVPTVHIEDQAPMTEMSSATTKHADTTTGYKSVHTEFNAIGDAGEYEGYFAVFGNVDDGNDITEPGCFRKTLAERAKRLKVLYDHDWSRVIGPAPDVIYEDQRGLYAKGHLTLGSFWGREVWELLKDGAVDEASFMYKVIKRDFDGAGVRHLREVALYELTFTPLGMNPLTEIRAIKAAIERVPGAPDGTPEPFETYIHTLEIISREFKEGRVLSATSRDRVMNAISALKGAMDALQELLVAAEPPQKDAHSALRLRKLRAAQLALALSQAGYRI
jgi:HK97 family phage prohead protease